MFESASAMRIAQRIPMKNVIHFLTATISITGIGALT
jgi:hypothetical protein